MAGIDLQASAGPLSAEIALAVGQAVQEAEGPPSDLREVPAWRARRWRRVGSPLWKRVTVSGTVTAAQAGDTPANAAFSWDIRPQNGRLWSVRKIMLQASQAGPWSSALANVVAAIFITGQPYDGLVSGQGFDAPNIDAEDTSFTLPNTRFYSTHQMAVRGNLWLTVAIQGTGVTSGVQLWGHATVLEIDDDPAFLLDL